MAKPTIVTRAGKGSALTWTEGDANFTNLQNATITVSDGTNSKALDLNSTLTFTAGTNVTLSVNSSTGAVTINSTGGSSVNLASPGPIGNTTSSTGRFTTIESTISDGTAPFIIASTTRVGLLNVSYSGQSDTIATTLEEGLSSTHCILFTGDYGLNNSAIKFSSTNLKFIPSTGLLTTKSLKFNDTREALYDLGTTGGTIAPNCTNGSVQKITLNSALTLNAFTSPVAGQSLTLIIYGGTAYTSITSTMKFAGGSKTLTGTAGCIDIVSIYYDGTNYFASIGKGFA